MNLILVQYLYHQRPPFYRWQQKNQMLCRANGEAKINDNALVALIVNMLVDG